MDIRFKSHGYVLEYATSYRKFDNQISKMKKINKCRFTKRRVVLHSTITEVYPDLKAAHSYSKDANNCTDWIFCQFWLSHMQKVANFMK